MPVSWQDFLWVSGSLPECSCCSLYNRKILLGIEKKPNISYATAPFDPVLQHNSKKCTLVTPVILFKGILTKPCPSQFCSQTQQCKVLYPSRDDSATKALYQLQNCPSFCQGCYWEKCLGILSLQIAICIESVFSQLLHTHIETNIFISSLNYYVLVTICLIYILIIKIICLL